MSDEPTASGQSAPAATEEVEKKVEETSTAAEASEEPAPTVDNAKPSESGAPAKDNAEDKEAQKEDTKKTDCEHLPRINLSLDNSTIVTHPGDHFLVKLKGYPQWPVIVCDEEMLPETLIKSRPVTAQRADGTYREDYADGGKRQNDRTFPVMYLRTNEFGWVPNSALQELSADRATELLTDKVKKVELRDAFELAIEQHPLNYYKEELQKYQEELAQKQAAKDAREAAKKNKKKAPAVIEDEDEDVDMADAADEEVAEPKEKSKTKKRKADEEAVSTPARTDSAKKPKIKLNTSSTPKTTNGATPKSGKESAAKPAKSKSSKKDGTEKKAEKEVPKEPELTAEEKHHRKEASHFLQKEVLFLRHKLQKGLLTRDQEPKEEEMKMMSDYITKLESFPDLEVSIIRSTKINKVLKAILKLDSIPKEEEFNFNRRSQTLLDKWTKILAGGDTAAAPAASVTPAPTNGVNGTKAEEKKDTPAVSEGVKEASKDAEKLEEADKVADKDEKDKKEQPEQPEKADEEPKKGDEPAEKSAEEVK
ncbi:PWWP domain-containing protein [Colletotrichum higginsianum]|nr:PWWP domain-containing protein [Colletotrichum higginsianum]